MRINKFLAQASGVSRRTADAALVQGDISVNGQPATIGQQLAAGDMVGYQGKSYQVPADDTPQPSEVLVLNKPTGYVVSRNGQGSRTMYELLPAQYHHLKPIGRLDKNSSGLLLLTSDGDLANRLTHPRYQKIKIYEVGLKQDLSPLHRQMISDHGIELLDGSSKLQLDRLQEGDDSQWLVMMHQGRNRQIRRTFAALGYDVSRLHRIQFGEYSLQNLKPGSYKLL